MCLDHIYFFQLVELKLYWVNDIIFEMGIKNMSFFLAFLLYESDHET